MKFITHCIILVPLIVSAQQEIPETWSFSGGPYNHGAAFQIGGINNFPTVSSFETYGFAASYKRIHVQYTIANLRHKLETDLAHDDGWNAGNMLRSYSINPGLGYEFLTHIKTRAMVFISPSITSFRTGESGKDTYRNTAYYTSFSGQIVFDYMLSDWDINTGSKTHKEGSHKITTPSRDSGWNWLWIIRATVGYYPNYYKQPLQEEGSLLVAMVGIGWQIAYSKPKTAN